MQSALDAFRPGETIHLPGATGELLALTGLLAAEPHRMRGTQVVSCLLPDMNRFDYAALDPEASVTTFLLPPALRPSFEAGRVRVLPLSYGAIAAWLRDTARLDTAVAHVSPPDAAGQCSFGIAADFSPIAWKRARRRVAWINPLMPSMPRGPRIALADADNVVEAESPLVEVAPPSRSATLDAIAQAAAAIIPDGATLQIGLGAAPGALCAALVTHRGLKLRSGMAPEGVRALAEAGSLAEPGANRVGLAAGPTAFYAWLAAQDITAFDDTTETHDVAALGAVDQFHAVNSAIEIDLLGQVNVEWRQGRLNGGAGGAPEFARAAIASPRGRSMILMPSTARGGGGSPPLSRIVLRIGTPTISLARTDIDVVVTEHGVADLRSLSIDARAAALIAVADPMFREQLARDWHEMRRTL